MLLRVVNILIASQLLIAANALGETLASPAATDAAMVILKNNCFACHNPQKKKGDLVLSSQDLALRGDKEGPVIVAGNPAESRLITALAADADPHMPPKKQLETGEIAALRAWVQAGAQWNDKVLAAVSPTTRPVTLQALPSNYRPVLAIALSADGKQLAVGRRERVYIHNLTQPNRPITRVLDGPPDMIRALACSADGKMLAAGGYRKVLVWTMASEEAPVELQGLEGLVTALCFLPDGRTLLAADGVPGGAGRIQTYDLPDPRPRKSVIAHADAVLSMHASSDGKMLASGGADKLVKLWELPALKESAKLEGHTSHILSVAMNADGSTVASAGADRDIKLWDVKTHEQKITIGPHTSRINALAWSLGSTLIAVGDDGSLRLDNIASKEPARAQSLTEDVLYCVAATSDGKTIFAGCHDGKVYVWSNGKAQPPLDEATAGSSRPN